MCGFEKSGSMTLVDNVGKAQSMVRHWLCAILLFWFQKENADCSAIWTITDGDSLLDEARGIVSCRVINGLYADVFYDAMCMRLQYSLVIVWVGMLFAAVGMPDRPHAWESLVTPLIPLPLKTRKYRDLDFEVYVSQSDSLVHSPCIYRDDAAGVAVWSNSHGGTAAMREGPDGHRGG